MSNEQKQEQLIANIMEQVSYPPYNLEQIGTDGLRLTLAVTGYAMDEIEIGVTDDFITIKGQKMAQPAVHDDNRKFLHHGISEQSFEKRFPLWGQIKIHGASFDNGFLIVDAVRIEPQAVVPRKIEIKPIHKAHNLLSILSAVTCPLFLAHSIA